MTQNTNNSPSSSTTSHPHNNDTKSQQQQQPLLSKYHNIQSLSHQGKYLDAIRLYQELLREYTLERRRLIEERLRQDNSGADDVNAGNDADAINDDDNNQQPLNSPQAIGDQQEENNQQDGFQQQQQQQDDDMESTDNQEENEIPPDILYEVLQSLEDEDDDADDSSDSDSDQEDADTDNNNNQQLPDEIRAMIRQQIEEQRETMALHAKKAQESHSDAAGADNPTPPTTTTAIAETQNPANDEQQQQDNSTTNTTQTTSNSPQQDNSTNTTLQLATKLPSFKKMIKEKQKLEKLYKTKRVGCPHYERNLQIKAPCCGKWYGCRRCHDEAEMMHQIDRFAIKQVKCLLCQEEQPVAQNCRKCGEKFAEYTCLTCNLFARPLVDTKKQIFHCDGCGICRVGDPDEFKHCDTCGLCIPTQSYSSHMCIKNVSRRECPVCFDDLHSSTKGLLRGACGHYLHVNCYNNMLNTGNFRCPICSKSLVDIAHLNRSIEMQIAHNPMPEQYKRKAKVICNECSKYSITDFHFVAMKCRHCQGYNTTEVDKIPAHRQAEAEEKKEEEEASNDLD